MFIDVKKIEDAPKDADLSVLENNAVQNHIKAEFERRMEVELSAVKNTLSNMKEEKQKLKAYLDEYKEKYKDIDLEEIKKLKSNSKNGMDLQTKAEIEALRQENEKSKHRELELQNELTKKDIAIFIDRSADQYNANSQLKLKDGAREYLEEMALEVFKKTDDGKFIPMEGDKVLSGEKGAMDGVEWIASLRDKSPKTKLLFNDVQGSGAKGYNGNAGGGYDPKKMGGTPDERKAAIAAKYNL